MSIHRLRVFGTLMLLPLALSSSVNADPAAPISPLSQMAPGPAMPATNDGPTTVDPKALALFAEVDKAAVNMRSFSADFATSSNVSFSHALGAEEGSVQYLRPNYMRTDTWKLKMEETSGKMARNENPTTVASDGTSKWVVTPDGTALQTAVAPSGKDLDSGFDPIYTFFDTSQSMTNSIKRARKFHFLVSLTYAGQKEWEGEKYDVVDWASKRGSNRALLFTQHLYIGADKVVHRIVYESNQGFIGEKTFHNVKVNPKISAKNFAFKLPTYAHLPESPTASPTILADGTIAPDFMATTLDGKQVHLSDYKGKPIILDFWATWCSPCLASMPHLNSVYNQVKDKGVIVLAVCVGDDRSAYSQWVTDNQTKYDFPTLFDPAGKTGKNIAEDLYKVSSIPAQFVIDKDGRIAASNVGYMEKDDNRLETELAKLGVDIPTATKS